MGATSLKYTSSEEDIICEFYDQLRYFVKQSEVFSYLNIQ